LRIEELGGASYFLTRLIVLMEISVGTILDISLGIRFNVSGSIPTSPNSRNSYDMEYSLLLSIGKIWMVQFKVL